MEEIDRVVIDRETNTEQVEFHLIVSSDFSSAFPQLAKGGLSYRALDEINDAVAREQDNHRVVWDLWLRTALDPGLLSVRSVSISEHFGAIKPFFFFANSRGRMSVAYNFNTFRGFGHCDYVLLPNHALASLQVGVVCGLCCIRLGLLMCVCVCVNRSTHTESGLSRAWRSLFPRTRL